MPQTSFPESPFAPHRATAVELQERNAALAGNHPFVIYREADGPQHIVVLGPDKNRLAVGRRDTNDIALDWDPEVSRVHAELHRVGDDWTVFDDGLSSNGTFVNGVRIGGRRRLADGDQIRFGHTLVVYRLPGKRPQSRVTLVPDEVSAIPKLSETQRNVLVALCRPYKDSAGFATPAKNREIADELYLSLDAVKANLRALFQKFGLGELPQNEKRARLVERAFQTGLVTEADL